LIKIEKGYHSFRNCATTAAEKLSAEGKIEKNQKRSKKGIDKAGSIWYINRALHERQVVEREQLPGRRPSGAEKREKKALDKSASAWYHIKVRVKNTNEANQGKFKIGLKRPEKRTKKVLDKLKRVWYNEDPAVRATECRK